MMLPTGSTGAGVCARLWGGRPAGGGGVLKIARDALRARTIIEPNGHMYTTRNNFTLRENFGHFSGDFRLINIYMPSQVFSFGHFYFF